MDTAISKINSINWIIKIIKYIKKILGINLLNKVNNKCPAIIFAVKRIERVKGRIIFLNVSINTIKNININGVPLGTKWVNINSVFFNHPNNINLNQIDTPKIKEKIRCLDLVKI